MLFIHPGSTTACKQKIIHKVIQIIQKIIHNSKRRKSLMFQGYLAQGISALIPYRILWMIKYLSFASDHQQVTRTTILYVQCTGKTLGIANSGGERRDPEQISLKMASCECTFLLHSIQPRQKYSSTCFPYYLMAFPNKVKYSSTLNIRSE